MEHTHLFGQLLREALASRGVQSLVKVGKCASFVDVLDVCKFVTERVN